PFFALGEVNLEAIESGEVPRWTGERDSYFLVDRPNIPVHPGASSIGGADALKGRIERVTIACPPRRVVLSPQSKRDRPRGKIEQVAIKSEVANWQLIFARVMQSNINSLPSSRCVVGSEIQERIKCCRRIGIQKCFT